MHILILPSEHFVTKKQPLGGVFQYEQANALADSGYQVGVISVGFVTLRYLLRRYPYRFHERLGTVDIYRFYRRTFLIERFVSLETNKIRQLSMFRKIYKKYKLLHGRPDVVHAHNFLYAGFLAEWLWDTEGIPFIITEHSSAFARRMISEKYDASLKQVARKAQFCSAVSRGFSDILQTRFGLEFDILHNMVSDIFFKGELLNKVENKNFIFLNVASLDGNKNHALLLRAFAAGFKCSSTQLRIAGDGPLKSKLVELARSLGIDDQVCFLGRCSRAEIAQEMRNANCFVLSSNFETFGVVLIEALASGLPLISTKSCGPEDILHTGNGILAEVGSSVQLTQAMIDVCRNYDQYHRHLLRAEAFHKFGEKAFVQNTTALYKMAIANAYDR